MIPIWLAFLSHLLGLLVGALCHALATRSRRTVIVDAKQARRWLATKPQIRVVTTTIRDEVKR